jgi:hypothetical protein
VPARRQRRETTGSATAQDIEPEVDPSGHNRESRPLRRRRVVAGAACAMLAAVLEPKLGHAVSSSLQSGRPRDILGSTLPIDEEAARRVGAAYLEAYGDLPAVLRLGSLLSGDGARLVSWLARNRGKDLSEGRVVFLSG